MLFPYLRCNECGWIPHGEMRKKAILFAKKYIKDHPKKENQLTIILEEEAKQTLHTIRKKKTKGKPTPPRQRKGKKDLRPMVTIIIVVCLVLLAIMADSIFVQNILAVIIVLILFMVFLIVAVQYRSKKKKRD
jgi:Flp pilus assembly protein TadB